jgi:hypothetical protein
VTVAAGATGGLTNQAVVSGAGASTITVSDTTQVTSLGSPSSSVTLTADRYVPVLNTAVMLTAEIDTTGGAAGPGGSVQFTDNGAVMGTVGVRSGFAAMQFTIGPGNHTIVAKYLGDGLYPSSSAMIGLMAAKPTPQTTMTSAVAADGSTTLTVTISGSAPGVPAPNGVVGFRDGFAFEPFGSATLVNGSATFTVSGLVPGTHIITGTYSGDANWSGVTAGTATITAH